MTTTSKSAYQQERRELAQQDAAFLSGLLQMLTALYCKAQDETDKPASDTGGDDVCQK